MGLLVMNLIIFRKFFICIFLVTIFYPLIYFSMCKGFAINYKETLLGNFIRVEKPKYNFEKLMNGDYQAQVYKYFKENFYGRALLIRVYNQLRYSCFQVSNRIVGKEGQIFEHHYLDDIFVFG